MFLLFEEGGGWYDIIEKMIINLQKQKKKKKNLVWTIPDKLFLRKFQETGNHSTY